MRGGGVDDGDGVYAPALFSVLVSAVLRKGNRPSCEVASHPPAKQEACCH